MKRAPLTPFSKNVVVFLHDVPSTVWFSDLIGFLGKLYRFVPLTAVEEYYYDSGGHSRNFCHISFDDGDISVYRNAFPVLKKGNIPASLFVSPSVIRNGANYWFQDIRGMDKELLKAAISNLIECRQDRIKKYSIGSLLKSLPIADIQTIIHQVNKDSATSIIPCNVSAEQLLKLHCSGLFTIGAHTMNHPILCNESDETARLEIAESIHELSAMLNARVTSFVYPNGVPGLDFGEREIHILKQEGITLAFSARAKWPAKTDDPLAAPRIGVTYNGNFLLLSKILLAPIWEKTKGIIKGIMRQPTEEAERAEIQRHYRPVHK